jgi:LysM repeat protein
MCCAQEKKSYKTAMNWTCWTIALIASGLVGCGIGRVVTAPVRYVFRDREPEPATATSDVTNPGQPVTAPSPTATPRVASRKSKQPSRVASKPSAKPSPSSQKSASATQFPVAKAVPGRPGLVFNPFNASGGYIDVSGYAPGSKVKDPDSQKIFIVP